MLLPVPQRLGSASRKPLRKPSGKRNSIKQNIEQVLPKGNTCFLCRYLSPPDMWSRTTATPVIVSCRHCLEVSGDNLRYGNQAICICGIDRPEKLTNLFRWLCY